MMRASVFRRSPLLLLATALVALAVFMVGDARPASADHEHTTTIWHATLTTPGTGAGCEKTGQSLCRNRLTDQRFIYDGTSYTVEVLWNNVSDDQFTIGINPLPSNSLRDTWTLYVDGRVFNLGDFTPDPNDNNYLKFSPSPRIPVWGTAGGKVIFTLQAPRPPAWSATLSPSDLSNFSGTGFGCQDGFLGCSQVLTGSNTFTYNGTSHTIDTIKVDGGVLTFATDLGQSGLQHLTLNVDGTAFALADAASNQWSNTGLTWSSGGSVELSLTGPPPTGVEISPNTLNVTEGGTGTFTVALTSDPGTDKTVQLVRTQFWQSAGEPGHVWDQGAATLSATSLTFTAGSSGNWATPQTVTVTGAEDPDTADQQLMVLVLEGSQSGDYRPIRGSGHNAVSGVHVTVADSGVNFVIEPPTNVQAFPGRDVGNENWLVRFSWDAPGGSQTVTGYDLQWRRADGSWPVGVTGLDAADTSRVVRIGNDASGDIGYRVRTRTADGVSPWIEGTVTLANPTNLVRSLYVLTGNAGELNPVWSAPADWPATDYEVHYREPIPTGDVGWEGMASDPAFGWVDANYTGGTDQLMTIPNLKDDTTYAVRVRVKSDWDFAWTVAEGGTATAIGGSEGSDGGEAQPTAVTLSLDAATVSEDAGDVTLTVTLDAPAPEGGIGGFLFAGDDGTATADVDFTLPFSIFIPGGERSATATVSIIDDAVDEADETVVMSALFDMGTAVLEDKITLTITDNDTCDSCGGEGDTGAVQQPDSSPQEKYADLIADMKEWRDDPCCAHNKAHTDRWDKALLAFGEPVADATLTPMTATEAQGYADRGWTRWERVAEALAELEAAPQQDPANSAPTVSSAIGDATIVSESGTQTVSLSGIFSDADNDALTVTAASSNEAVATVSVAADYSTLTVTAKSRGTATITVTADDGNGGTVSDAFAVRVKAAPVVASALADVGMEEEENRDISLSGVFSDADGDTLTLTAASSDAAVDALEFQGTLTLVAVSAGSSTITVTATDSDGNAVSDSFDVTVTAPQQQDPPPEEQQPDEETTGEAPTVAAPLDDISLQGPAPREIALDGVFSGDGLTITAVSSNFGVASVWVSGSTLTAVGTGTGTATITVTAEDADGNTVSDEFEVTVSPAS